MERVFTLKKRFLFPALLFVFIAIIFTIGCTNHLLKPHQSDLSILVKLEKSSGRNITTGDYQITTWIENRDGTESHHQEINSTAGADASIIFEELAIGSEINIHLEVVETGTTGKKLVGTSDWITVNEGTNVVVIVLREDSDTVTAVTASIGDIVFSDGTISTNLVSGKTPVGIVIKTTNSQPTLILALNNGSNSELTYSKAEEACASYGTVCGDGKTWRIPSANEWSENIYKNKDKIQSALTTAGGSQMGTGYYYWTSDNYQRIILSSGTLNTADRTDPENASTTHVRFVRDWQ